MSHTIAETCFSCGDCGPKCPTGAIQINDGKYWIEAGLCNNCEGYYPEPQCVITCAVSSPAPLKAKKGRYKIPEFVSTSPDLFSNIKNTPFASSMVVWEASNLLAGTTILPWQTDDNQVLYYQKQVKQGHGAITYRITEDVDSANYISDAAALKSIDIRSACLHLIYAAYATLIDKPWEQEFVIDDRQIEKYLGLDKRKDLSKASKLTLIKILAQQPCRIMTEINWPRQGRVNSFQVEEDRLWHLLEIKHSFQTDEEGSKHLTGLTFKIRAGMWSKYFLNKHSYRQQSVFYQYGTLPYFLLNTVTTIWQQHQGTVRMMLWLLFKMKMGSKQCITIPTLMRVAYGEEKISQANSSREQRKRLIRTFESDLEVLNHYGIKPVFDPITYPDNIQPLWAKLAELPDDAEEAMLFWINDGSQENRLTDISPRGKWQLLMKARILHFELPLEWEQKLAKLEKKKQQKQLTRKSSNKRSVMLYPEQIQEARQNKGLSQRELAQLIGKSQSWVRDLEHGRFAAKVEDQNLLRKVLDLAVQS